MDEMRWIEPETDGDGTDPVPAPPVPPPAIGTDERRMHVRAYNFWVSMLDGKVYPSIEDLDPATAVDFRDHSVLLDFTAGIEDPAIAYLGGALRRECGLAQEIASIGDVPSRSLLSRLTDHYLQIIANRAPIGFEAEFVNQRGLNTLYRGILMPYSSDDDTIDFVYGVINWKEVAEAAEDAIVADAARLTALETQAGASAPAWADGPSGSLESDADPDPGHNATLADHLSAARDGAEAAQGSHLRSRAALYRALTLAYDFSRLAMIRPDEYAGLLDDCGIKAQARAPMTAVIKLVFGAQVDKARATEFAATLAHAHRIGISPGALAGHLDALPGGLKAMVAAERKARKPAAAPPSHAEIARGVLRKVTPQLVIDLPSDAGEFVLLLARRETDGRLAVIAPVPDETSLVDRAIRKITR